MEMQKRRRLGRGEEVPEPFREEDVPDRFWPKEHWDTNLPSPPGFLNDFVLYTRGIACPTAFAFWTAVSVVSSVLKRETFIPWGLGALYSNFYIILIAPPGIAKKGTIIDAGTDLLYGCNKYYVSENVKGMKTLKILKNKATPEALASAMLPVGHPIKLLDSTGKVALGPRGAPLVYRPTSEISIHVPELESMLGKVEYTKGMTGFLMDIYDPHERWEVNTLSRGKEVLRHLCTNFLGATTPAGLQKSINDTALEDGFLSRSTLVFQPRSTRRYSMPRVVVGGPPKEEMKKRLAWIAENNMGPHTLTEDAKSVYDEWYNEFMDDLEAKNGHAHACSRMDIQVLKLALILKCCRYDISKEITKNDIETAIQITKITAASYTRIFQSIGASSFLQKIDAVADYIRMKKRATRSMLIRNTRLTADEISTAVSNLSQSGQVRIFVDRREKDFPSKRGDEEYRWAGVEKEDDEEEKGARGAGDLDVEAEESVRDDEKSSEDGRSPASHDVPRSRGDEESGPGKGKRRNKRGRPVRARKDGSGGEV